MLAEGTAVGVLVGVAVFVGLGVAVAVLVAVGMFVGVAVFVKAGVAVAVLIAVGVLVGIAVFVEVGFGVGVQRLGCLGSSCRLQGNEQGFGGRGVQGFGCFDIAVPARSPASGCRLTHGGRFPP